LYNLKNVNFLGHGGSFKSVKEIIVFENAEVSENIVVPQNKLSDQFKPLGLTDAEID
jgi:cytochrome c peroxidase